VANPDSEIYTIITGAGIHTTYSCSVGIHPIRDVDTVVTHKAVFIVMSGEDSPIDYMDGSGNGFRRRRVQVVVRSAPDEYQAGQTLTYVVRDVLHLATISGKVGCRVFSGPWLIEKDNQDRYIWSMNVEIWEVS